MFFKDISRSGTLLVVIPSLNFTRYLKAPDRVEQARTRDKLCLEWFLILRVRPLKKLKVTN